MSNWDKLTRRAQKRVVRQWEEFADALIFVTDRQSDATSATSVELFLANFWQWAEVDLQRWRYVRTLAHHGLLDELAPLPNDDFLWEMHPMNIEAER